MDKISDIAQTLSFDLSTAIFSVVNFLIVYFILSRFVFGKVGEIIKDRREKVEESLAKSIQADTKLNSAEKDANKIISDAKSEAQKIIEQAYEISEQDKLRIVSDAEAKSQQLIDKAKEEAAGAKAEAFATLEEEYNELVKRGVMKAVEQFEYKKMSLDKIDDVIEQTR